MNELNEQDFYAGKLTDEELDAFLDFTDNPNVRFDEVLGSKLFDFGKHKLEYRAGDNDPIVIKRRYFFIIKEEKISLDDIDEEELFGPNNCVLLASDDEKKAKKFRAFVKMFHLNEKYDLGLIPQEIIFNMEGEIIPGPKERKEMMEEQGMFLLK